MQPHSISDLVLWLDAASIQTTGADNTVLRWPDISGRRYDAVFKPFVINWDTGVRLAHQPPSLVPNAIHGRPAVHFNALYGETLLLTEAAGPMDRHAPGFSIVFVLRSRRIQPQPGPKYLFITHNRENHQDEKREAGNTRFAVMRAGDTGAMRMHVRRGKRESGGFFAVESGDGQFGDMEWGVAIFTMDYTQSVATQRYNGRLIGSQDMPDSGPTEDYDSPIASIASTSEGNYLTCDIAEIIAYRRALTEAELSELETGLLAKYGLPG